MSGASFITKEKGMNECRNPISKKAWFNHYFIVSCMVESNQDQYESWNEENVRLGELNRKNIWGILKETFQLSNIEISQKKSTANLEMSIIP